MDRPILVTSSLFETGWRVISRIEIIHDLFSHEKWRNYIVFFYSENLKATIKLWISTLDFTSLKAKIDLVSLYLQQLSLPGIQQTLSQWLFKDKINHIFPILLKHYWDLLFARHCYTTRKSSFVYFFFVVTFLTSWNLMEYINLYWHTLRNFSIADTVVKWGLKKSNLREITLKAIK